MIASLASELRKDCVVLVATFDDVFAADDDGIHFDARHRGRAFSDRSASLAVWPPPE